MKKSFILTFSVAFVLSYIVFPTNSSHAEEVDVIETGDTLQLILEKHDIEMKDPEVIEDIAMKESEVIDVRFLENEQSDIEPMALVEKKEETLTLTKKEENLLARLVHAEAKGEPFAGKVAVATVVLNRVEDEQFPDTVKDVIYEENAFEPVQNGSINEPANKEAHKAVQEALKNEDKNDELLYFYNPETATSDWILTREVVKTIGNHAFAI
ncbi:cell wall hydrolase [uncultured Metabacillus sp.]|uniref:cell wall hydrolase n=1 Tax=uncultured Metabacillus sp. TaxID=2860135 RepID=UPI0026164B12|nr:cell wall hydrolase [uncultured Metabacillus sp.]